MSLCLKVRKPQLLIPQFLTKRYYKMGRQAMEDTLVDLGGAQGSRAPSRTKNFLDGMFNGLPKKTQQQFGLRYFITCYLQGIVMGTEYY